MAVYKCTAFKSGDGWKDTTRKGDVVFAYGYELPPPFVSDCFQIVGNAVRCVCTDQWTFEKLRRRDLLKLLPEFREDIRWHGIRQWLHMLFSNKPEPTDYKAVCKWAKANQPKGKTNETE